MKKSKFKFKKGQIVVKPKGYKFDGYVRMRGRVTSRSKYDNGNRYVVECIAIRGLLHIFSENQLANAHYKKMRFDVAENKKMQRDLAKAVAERDSLAGGT
jgi:hypothetical protein